MKGELRQKGEPRIIEKWRGVIYREKREIIKAHLSRFRKSSDSFRQEAQSCQRTMRRAVSPILNYVERRPVGRLKPPFLVTGHRSPVGRGVFYKP